MRIAVFSDIHGNGVALEAVLADIKAKAPDRLVCLGDAVQGGPQPAQFVRRIGAGPQIHFNPGSVGLAYSHHQPDGGFQMDHWAEYAMLTSAPSDSLRDALRHQRGLTNRQTMLLANSSINLRVQQMLRRACVSGAPP